MATAKGQGKPPYLERSHLQSKPPVGRAPRLNNIWSEAYCKECNARITVGPDGDEYGHARGTHARNEMCSHHFNPEVVDDE